jgi:hypothetical protein
MAAFQEHSCVFPHFSNVKQGLFQLGQPPGPIEQQPSVSMLQDTVGVIGTGVTGIGVKGDATGTGVTGTGVAGIGAIGTGKTRIGATGTGVTGTGATGESVAKFPHPTHFISAFQEHSCVFPHLSNVKQGLSQAGQPPGPIEQHPSVSMLQEVGAAVTGAFIGAVGVGATGVPGVMVISEHCQYC